MPRGNKSSDISKRRLGATETGDPPKGVPRPQAAARAWPAANKLQGDGKKLDARRKLPSGPVGGSGRKTNLSRSS